MPHADSHYLVSLLRDIAQRIEDGEPVVDWNAHRASVGPQDFYTLTVQIGGPSAEPESLRLSDEDVLNLISRIPHTAVGLSSTEQST